MAFGIIRKDRARGTGQILEASLLLLRVRLRAARIDLAVHLMNLKVLMTSCRLWIREIPELPVTPVIPATARFTLDMAPCPG